MEAAAPPKKPVSGGSPGGSGSSSAAIAFLALLAGSGAASHPGGVLFGVPSLPTIALAATLGGFVYVSGARGLSWFILPGIAGVLGASFTGAGSSLLLFTGPPLFALVLAALVLCVAAAGRKPPRAALLPTFFAIYSAVAYQAQTRVGPEGDEPQYLMVAESLLRDGDLALDQDFKEARYRAFLSRSLEPHFRIRGPEGQIYSLHAVGLSVLILPAYAFAGYAGASFFMAFVGALLVREIRRFLSELLGDETVAEGAAWLVGLSPPLLHFAGLVFTEVPAALLLCLGLRTAVFGRTGGASIAASLCVAALPWLNVRYAILSVAVFGALALRLMRERGQASSASPRDAALAVAIPAASAAALGLYHYSLWGFFDPRRVYGRRREFSLDVLPEGLPGLFFDQEFGLFVYAPIFALSLAGFFALGRRNRALATAGLFAAAGVIATASVWPMWRGGFNPPARFLVPLIPVFAAGLALILQRGLPASTALLAGWSLWCGLAGAMNIETIHRDRDGVAPFFRTQAGAREWTAALPSFVLEEDRPTRGLAVPWAILLLLPVVGAMRPERGASRSSTSRKVFVAVAAFLAAAVAADQASPRARSPERNATRRLGEPSLLLPAVRFDSDAVATWPIDLLYEPHRHPEGQWFARQVRLSSGRYELRLQGEEPPAGPPPNLLFADHRTGDVGSQPMRAGPLGLQAAFVVLRGGEFDLRLSRGAPGTFEVAHLRRVGD